MTDNYRDEMREAREALEDLLSFEYRRGVSCQKNAFALEGGGRRCLCNSCIEDRARAALSRLSAQADPALDAREFVRDWIVANHGVLSMAGAAAQDLIARLQARLSASAPVPVPVIGTGETPTGCAPMWVNLEDEGWTWDDLARVLTERYDEPDLSELIRLLVERMPSLSASGQGDTCIGCEHDGEQDKWRPCSSCARNSHDNYESRKS